MLPPRPRAHKISTLSQRLVWAFAMMSRDAACLAATNGTQMKIDSEMWFHQRVRGINIAAYWPMHRTSTVNFARRVWLGVETAPGIAPGCMVHAQNGIHIGDYTQISQNVALLSGNHDPYDLPEQTSDAPIRIGRYSLLGFNSVILPGVELGDYTIVGANSVVTRSYPKGYTVLAGAPAQPVRQLDPTLAKDHTWDTPYHGYISAADFPAFAKQYLVES
jgi:acetyltransferase-like isoleucine patch superfamily enzyme